MVVFSRRVSKYDWLLFFHVTGAFLFLGGIVVAWVLGIAAALRERPSEVALLLRLTGAVAASIGVGMLLTIIFGLWLVFDLDIYDLWDGWVISALVMWALAGAFGGQAGKRDTLTRRFAEQLAAEGDVPSDQLRARVRDPLALSLNVASSLLGIAILAVMIFKPGAGG
jgi:uncharacterized membrane protein